MPGPTKNHQLDRFGGEEGPAMGGEELGRELLGLEMVGFFSSKTHVVFMGPIYLLFLFPPFFPQNT